MKHFRTLLLLMALLVSAMSFAQHRSFSGVVVDSQGEPVIGASVVQEGTSQGSVTDLDGKFTVSVTPGATLVVSYIGYNTQRVKAADNLRIVLQEDTKALDEVVVVGYGVQKKSVVTASIAKVNSEDLATTAPLRVDNALKGLASGVSVTTSSGQPGAGSQIRVRGVGTINNSDPIYIVDGMPIQGGIDYLNPSDIESLEVLKDAASGAIYGARAANGVVLVTTKGGKKGKAQVNYNFSYGWQNPWKHRDVLDATSYAVMINEGLVNAGRAPKYSDPYELKDVYGNRVTKGTDWQDAVFNDNAPVMNHEVNVSGAGDKLNYYLSMGYFTQEGIVGGNFGRSNYDRLTLRSNTKYTLFDDTKERNWLNKLDLTANLSYARVHSTGIDTNSGWGSVLGSALTLSPILTPTVSGKTADAHVRNNQNLYSLYVPFYTGRTDADGYREVYTNPGADYNEMGNPLAILSLPPSKGWSHKLVANIAASLQLWEGLTYRFSYGADQSFWGSDGYTPIYYIRNGFSSDKTNANSSSSRGTVWQVDNTLTFDRTFGDHHVNAVLGQSAMASHGAYLSASRDDITNLARPYIDASTGMSADGKQYAGGAPADEYKLASLFARVSYDYGERYMAEFTVRRDGSSRFGSNNHYATFPSFSLGWNFINEQFMEQSRSWLSNGKLRFSWGKNGNDNIGNYRYTVLAATGNNNNYILGRDDHSQTGSKASGLPNPSLKWEESIQTDLGLELGFLNNALTLTADYYYKKTSGMLMAMNIPDYVGETKPLGNVGVMENSGMELELSYKWHVADAHFRVSGNVSYLHNKLVKYGNDTGFANLDTFQGIGTITRGENGLPFPFFYGFKSDGVFQNAAEVAAYKNKEGELIMPNAKPGDVRFVDMNGDGTISDDDQTKIGKGMPDWSFGLNFAADWKGFDFSFMLQGVAGNDIFDATRRTDIDFINLPTWMLGRWTGEGTSNKYPLFRIGDTSTNWRSSDLYLTDGSYLRLKNIQLGYTLPRALTQKVRVQKLRLFVAAENLLTFTKYAGFDPEIPNGNGGTSLGVDYGIYPQARTWTVGFNLSF
ncbi:SusC/RagA family TonB-linked outer membrane protein [Prevotella sp.]|uniref:SusC/RagA family TonB-linked outer membrane protein n=1 Tax=Prevotella sp. TaxID=59823 RepID=UPI002F94C998